MTVFHSSATWAATFHLRVSEIRYEITVCGFPGAFTGRSRDDGSASSSGYYSLH